MTRSWIYTTILLLCVFKGDGWHVSRFDKNFNGGFFLMHCLKAISFKLCMCVILLGVYRFIPCLMILTLFASHFCRNCVMCVILLGVYQFIPCLMILTMFASHFGPKHQLQTVFLIFFKYFSFSLMWFEHCMVTTVHCNIRMIIHNIYVLYDSGV